ncbi:MAG TPA: thioredoxin-dependent thiol peroxidase [Rhizomicrobium sp.]|nr:thioredoxin-dependent thiol peroxidase [Rhizomicrobium sp.]
MANNLSPGDRAPAFRLPTDNGGEISPAKLKGKPFVVYFYPRDDTSGCTKEAIAFSDEKKRFAALGVAIIGISKDSVESHKKFREKHKLEITLASDPELEAANAYGVWVEKSMYGRRYMGMDRATFLVDDKGKIRQIWRKVKVPGHVAAVLDAAGKL